MKPLVSDWALVNPLQSLCIQLDLRSILIQFSRKALWFNLVCFVVENLDGFIPQDGDIHNTLDDNEFMCFLFFNLVSESECFQFR